MNRVISIVLLLTVMTLHGIKASGEAPDSLLMTVIKENKAETGGGYRLYNRRLEVVDRINMATSSPSGFSPSDFKSLVKTPTGLSFSYRPGIPTAWKTGYLRVASGAEAMPGMMGVEYGSAGIGQNLGRFSLSSHVDVMRYGFYRGVVNQYGIGGAITYHASDRVSVTLFGNYYTRLNNRLMTPGMLGYAPFSSFGGVVDVRISDGFGLTTGVSAGYVPYNNRWEMRPVIMPYFSMKGSKIGIDVGSWIGDLLGNAIGTWVENYNSSRKSGVGSLRPGDRGYILPHRR